MQHEDVLDEALRAAQGGVLQLRCSSWDASCASCNNGDQAPLALQQQEPGNSGDEVQQQGPTGTTCNSGDQAPLALRTAFRCSISPRDSLRACVHLAVRNYISPCVRLLAMSLVACVLLARVRERCTCVRERLVVHVRV